MMQPPLMSRPDSRRVSLPTTLMSPRLYPAGCRLSPTISPTRLSPIKSPTRRSLPPTPPTPRRSLPGTPRSPTPTPRSGSPRPLSPRRLLPDVDEHFQSSSSSSAEHTPHHGRRRRYRYSKYQSSFRDSGIMDSESNWGQVGRAESHEGQLRSFAYKYGSVFDNGYEAKEMPQEEKKPGDNRRATCPEICLFPPTNRPSRRVVLRVYGEKNSGKKTLLHQLHRHASNTHDEVMVDDDDGTGRRSSFLLNGEEIRLELLIEAALEMEPFSCNLPVYIIMYSVDSRESFHYAQQLLSRIAQMHADKPTRTILVGNKLDLKRNQVVTSIEGKCMSKIYKSSYVEVSALLGMNLDVLWAELIRQLEHPGETTWMERVVNRGKVFAKSCETIIKMIAA